MPITSSEIPQAMNDKAQELKHQLPDDKFLELQRIILLATIEQYDDEKLTMYCREFRTLIDNLDN